MSRSDPPGSAHGKPLGASPKGFGSYIGRSPKGFGSYIGRSPKGFGSYIGRSPKDSAPTLVDAVAEGIRLLQLRERSWIVLQTAEPVSASCLALPARRAIESMSVPYLAPNIQHLMSRSLHTDPDSIRAARSLRRSRKPARWPRVRARPAQPGRAHPASPAEITRLLSACGDICRSGIEAIDLLPGRRDPVRIRLGALKVPGRIVLYDQPLSPWLIPGHLDYREERRMRRAGALIERVSGGVRVEWPGDTLRDFMLFEVLMHEIGHHVLQHYAGKRNVRVARTRDHEAFASRFAARCRRHAQGEA